MRLYLAHPFETRKQVREIELALEQQTGVVLLNPFYDEERFDVIEIDAGRAQRYQIDDPHALVTHDLSLIDSCDGVCAYVPGDCTSFGTPCECWYAMSNGQVVNFVGDNIDHPWIRHIANQSGGARFKTWSDFKEWLLLNANGYDLPPIGSNG